MPGPAEFRPSVHFAPRRTMLGRRGAVATSQPLAAEAGLFTLRQGGTAVDAAVAMAAALPVVEPTSNGFGGDAFALVWAEGRLHGLNGSGRAPGKLTAQALRRAGFEAMPERGWWPVTVPGAPAAWKDLHHRFGRLPFAGVLAPAIALAEEGFPVSPVVATNWKRAAGIFLALEGPEYGAWSETFTSRGVAPGAGAVWRAPDHAATLRRLADTGCRDFYEGGLARAIDAFARRTGGLLRGEDLAAHRSDWVDPVSVAYREAELWEIPPNGPGIVALSALGILEGLPPSADLLGLEGVHREMEALKLAFADARAHVADPDSMLRTPAELIDPHYLAHRRSLIRDRAEIRETGLPRGGGTVYLCAADGEGMMVSFIQSNYMGFGSGVVVPGTGIALQNRGLGFTMEEGHPNAPAPGKRPLHTIIPGFLTRGGKPWGPLGVMGGHMQPQGHVQVVRALVDGGLDPQAALDLPRWFWERGLQVYLENAAPRGEAWDPGVVEALRARGHQVELTPEVERFGRGQIILRDEYGVLAAGSDWRADGQALVF